MMLITALPEKAAEQVLARHQAVRPKTTSTTSATTSARTRSNRNITIVKTTSASTSSMSVVSVSAVSDRRPRRFPVRDRSACRQRSYSRSHTPWPSFWPRVSKWVCGRHASGRGTAPRTPARLAMPSVASSTSHICSA